MSTETKVKQGNQNSDSLITTKSINLGGGKAFQTPVKVVDLNKILLKYNLPDEVKHLNEIFKRVDAKYLKKYVDETEFEEKQNSEFFDRLSSRVTHSEGGKLCFLEFKDDRLPTWDEIETLTDISHPYSDITPLPIIPGLKKLSDTQLREYIQFLSDSIEVIEQFNDKPIMGIIPRIQLRAIPKIIGFYLDKGINSFAVDLDGSCPPASYPRIRRILRTIKKDKPIEDCFIHAYNVGPGRPNKPEDVIPAKDILGLWMHFDSIGDRHKPWVPNPYFVNFDREKYKFRLFDKEDYGYWRGITAGKAKDIHPDDSNIPSELFEIYRNKTFVKNLFNTEQLALEANRIANVINEDPEDPNTSTTYIESKRQVSNEDLKKILKLNKELSVKS